MNAVSLCISILAAVVSIAALAISVSTASRQDQTEAVSAALSAGQAVPGVAYRMRCRVCGWLHVVQTPDEVGPLMAQHTEYDCPGGRS